MALKSNARAKLVQYILAIDQGTTGTTATILSLTANSRSPQLAPKILASSNVEFPQHFPKPGWVEHDLNEIWDSVLTSVKQVLKISKVPGKKITAIGITNQRETVCFWHKKTLKPLCNAVVWQDRRTSTACQKLKNQNLEGLITEKTGLLLDPYFSGTKMALLLPGLLKKYSSDVIAAGTIESFLVAKLTAGLHVTEPSNACRTLLFNIKTLDWDEELLKLFNVPKQILPKISLSAGPEAFGKTKNVSILPDGIPITGVLGDQQAALFGQGCFEVGEAKCTYGTGSFILTNTGKKMVRSGHKQLTTVAWNLDSGVCYALEGSAFAAGACVQWLRDGLGFFKTAREIEGLAKKVSSSEGVFFVPALVGLGTPYWDSEARGSFLGLTRGSQREHLCRAVLEGIAFINADILTAMQKDMKQPLARLRVDGGASKNNLLMQLQAETLGCTISRSSNVETTSLGAALIAGLGAGLFKSLSEVKLALKDLDAQKKSAQEFHPKMNAHARSHWLASWKQAVGATREFKLST